MPGDGILDGILDETIVVALIMAAAIALWLSGLFWFTQVIIRLRPGVRYGLSYAVTASFLMGVSASMAAFFWEESDSIPDSFLLLWVRPVVIFLSMLLNGYWGALAAGALAMVLVGLSMPRARKPVQMLGSVAFAGIVGSALPWAVVYAEGRYLESKLVFQAQLQGLRCIEVRDFAEVLRDYDPPPNGDLMHDHHGIAFRDGQPWNWSYKADSWVKMDGRAGHLLRSHPCFRPASAQMGAAGGK